MKNRFYLHVKRKDLEPVEQLLFGSLKQELLIHENGLKFLVSPVEGQKTGFFWTIAGMREQVKGLSQGKRVLNCFAYTGGLASYAASGGAALVSSVDISEAAMLMARKNAEINVLHIPMNSHRGRFSIFTTIVSRMI